MAYFGKKNHTILEAIPQPPPYFFNLTRTAGINVVGDVFYTSSKQSIIHPFQRNKRIPPIKTRHHDFLIGFLLVLFIPIISEIVQTILLRSRSRKINSSALYMAYLVDEFSHLRNIWVHLTSPTPQTSQSFSRRITGSRTTKLSLIAIFIAAIVFFADVATLQVSQKVRVYSSASEYNLRAFQPIGTNKWRAKQIRRQSEFAPCILPFFQTSFHTLNFQLSTCIVTESAIDLDQKKDVSGEISIGSWYHKGGSDHIVLFGNARIRISVRAQLVFYDSLRKILFHTSDSVMEDTQFIHNKTIYTAMQYACNKKFSQSTCEEMVHNLSVMSIVQQNRIIVLWERDSKNVIHSAHGLVSTFHVKMNQPFYAVRNSSHYLMASSAIMSIKGYGWYQDSSTGKEVIGIAGLVAENGRIAGLPIILICIVIGAALLAVVRFCLSAVSLATLAVYRTQCGERRARAGRRQTWSGGDCAVDKVEVSMGRETAFIGAGDAERKKIFDAMGSHGGRK